MPLSIEDYRAAERSATQQLSLSHIMAFSTATFNIGGFPARIESERELPRYADWNCQGGSPALFEPDGFVPGLCLRTHFTADEAALINELCDKVVKITGRVGRAVRPVSNHMVQMGLFRIIEALSNAHGNRPLSIFEIGPGTGYLGALLGARGHQYAAMDNCEAYYLFQSHLLEEVAGGDFSEWARPGANGHSIARITHVPWWEFVNFFPTCPFKADVIVSNANLGEMHREALLFIRKVAPSILREGDIRMLLFTTVGEPRFSDLSTVERLLGEVGFIYVFRRNMHGFVLEGSTAPLRAPWLEVDVPLFNPSGDPRRLAPSQFLRMPRAQRPLDIDFAHAVLNWIPLLPE